MLSSRRMQRRRLCRYCDERSDAAHAVIASNAATRQAPLGHTPRLVGERRVAALLAMTGLGYVPRNEGTLFRSLG